MTCHGLAMRLLGASFSVRADTVAGDARKREPDDDSFAEVLRQAISLLQGEGLPPEELDENRQRLLAGFRWILVEEYQDIGPGSQYELISALSGRKLKEEQDRLSLFAVGDDDQNIYAYAGASVEYIRRFESDYDAKRAYLIENYRSTANIIEAANKLIAPASRRMKPGSSHLYRYRPARLSTRWRLARNRPRGAGPGANPSLRRYRLASPNGLARVAPPGGLGRAGLGLGQMRGDRPRMEISRSGAGGLRA